MAAILNEPVDLMENDPFAISVDIEEPSGDEPTAWWCTHRYSCKWTKCCSGKMTQIVGADYWQ